MLTQPTPASPAPGDLPTSRLRQFLLVLVRRLGALYQLLFAARIVGGKQRSFAAVLGFTVLIALVEWSINPTLFHDRDRPILQDYHATLSLEMAVHRHQFGLLSHVM